MFHSSIKTDASENQLSLKFEELAAQKTAMIGRTVALFLVAPLITILVPWPGPVYNYGLLLVFALLGWGAWLVAKSDWGKPWHQYAFVSADFILLTYAILSPNPLIPFDAPPQFVLRFGAFIFFFMLIAGLAYVYQPRLVLWGGFSAAISWTIGVLWLLALPDTIWRRTREEGLEGALADLAQPTFIDIFARVQEVSVLLIVAGLLALAVKRSKMVALRQAKLGRERENLGRYFSRQTAQMLAERTDPFSQPSEHNCAVLFADLVAFTSWSEKHTSQEVIELLRAVHGVLAEVVFRNNGTLDKFIGDGLMATFGTPEPSQSDASDALAAMVEMHEAFERWKRSGTHPQAAGLNLAVGAHYGPVVIGNIGSKDRLEFAVLGDTVNVASRLEGATRVVGCHCLASATLVEAAIAERGGQGNGQPLLEHHGIIPVRGRVAEIEVYKI